MVSELRGAVVLVALVSSFSLMVASGVLVLRISHEAWPLE